jgi:hypothetical protein
MARKRIDEDPVNDEDLIPIPKGQPISEEFAGELAREAERGYADIDKWKKEYVGRIRHVSQDQVPG